MKKDIILQTAARLFAQNGYTRTSTALLAAEAGVAEGTIFRHFKSKEHIFIALIERLRDKMKHDVYQYLEIQGDETRLEHILSTIKACYIFMNKNNSDFAILLRYAPGSYVDPSSPAFETSRAIYVILQNHFQKAIEQGQKEQHIRDDIHPHDTACFLASSLVGLMRAENLNFLKPSEDMLKTLLFSVTCMLEKRD